MHIINIDNQYIFKTKSLYLNCYSINSTVWKHLDKLFLKSLCLNTEYLTVKNNICFIEIFTSIFTVKINKIDGRKIRNINYLSIWHLIEYIEKHATIEQYQNLASALYSKGSM
jgi:hypothetical protein